MFIEMIADYCQTHTKHINKLYGQNAEVHNIKGSGTFSYTSTLGA